MTSNWTQNEYKFIDFYTGDEFAPIGQYFLHFNANDLPVGPLPYGGTLLAATLIEPSTDCICLFHLLPWKIFSSKL